MVHSTNISTLEGILSQFFDLITTNDQKVAPASYLRAMTSVFRCQAVDGVIPFALDDESTANVINQLKEHMSESCPELLKSLNMPLTYLFDELICNIQQHAQTDKGYAYLKYTNRKILALPPEIDFKGTMIMVRIPAQVPNGFNIYDYMS